MGFALLNGENANAKEKVSDIWKNAGRLKQVKEEAVDGAIPKSIINYANDKYKSLLLAASQYDNTIGRNIFEASLEEPFVVLNDSNQEVYYFPVMAKDEIIYVIAVINTTEGLTMSGSYEMVDMLNSEMNDTTLIVYDEEEEIVETVNIMDEEYEEVVEETAEFVEDMQAVDVDNIKDICAKEGYSPTYSYNNAFGSTTGRICNLYNPKAQGSYGICWAASVATIVNYLNGSNITAKNVCDKLGVGYVAKTINEKKDALARYGWTYFKTDAQLTWNSIKNNIDNKFPIAASTFTSNNDGHAITVHGYITYSTNSVKYIYFWNSGSNSVNTAVYKFSGTTYSYNSKLFMWTKSLSKYK